MHRRRSHGVLGTEGFGLREWHLVDILLREGGAAGVIGKKVPRVSLRVGVKELADESVKTRIVG